MNDTALERRPLATRDYAISKRAARWIARSGITPNQISGLGMLFGITSGVALALTPVVAGPWWRVLFLAGALLTQMRLGCNMFDGMVAIEQRKGSSLGELFNEIPDRVSDSATLIGFGFALGGHIQLGFAAALLAMFTAYIRAMGKVAGAEQHFCGPMSKPQRMFTVTAAALVCAFAPLSWWDALPLGVPALALLLICAGALLGSLRRLGRIARNLREAS